ncbi:hypothetical protein R1sor_007798 [Riccia sorocarpa]|uniref:Reverse transcriptase zinc-binding domain-containing protein n=1 Tax=Riccia sorocarpa TaxID=122646 RepID=A0ABD3HUD4_9MARC
MDIYLEPLVEELKQLWEGVRAYDASTQCPREDRWFILHAICMWTIHDSPGLGFISGLAVSGTKGCPACRPHLEAQYSPSLRSTYYLGHEKYLPLDHPLRNGCIDPIPPTMTMLDYCVLETRIQEEEIPRASSGVNRMSILIELPYWDIRTDAPPQTLQQMDGTKILRSFTVQEDGRRQKVDQLDTTMAASWYKCTAIPTTRGRKANSQFVLPQPHSLEEALAQLQWSNGYNLFYLSNKYICNALLPDKKAAMVRMSKWKRITPFKERDVRRWSAIWNSKRPARQASFLWLIPYSALAVNKWRFPTAQRLDSCTWCTRCDTDRAEDIPHMLWTCSTSKPIWEWAFSILHRAFPITRGWKPRLAHALLAEPLPAKYKKAAEWWEIRRGIVL